jgi:hypothetical protein
MLYYDFRINKKLDSLFLLIIKTQLRCHLHQEALFDISRQVLQISQGVHLVLYFPQMQKSLVYASESPPRILVTAFPTDAKIISLCMCIFVIS